MGKHEIKLSGDEDDVAVELEMTDAEYAFLKKVAAALNSSGEAGSRPPGMLIDGEEVRPRCTCDALVYSRCRCDIEALYFLNTGGGRRIDRRKPCTP